LDVGPLVAAASLLIPSSTHQSTNAIAIRDLSDNQLKGTLPKEWSTFQSLYQM
jgi:hypothetical protein